MDTQNQLCVGTVLITSTAVALTILNQRRRQQMRVRHQSLCVWERPHIRDFADPLQIQHFKLTRVAFNDLCDAMLCLLLHQTCHALWSWCRHGSVWLMTARVQCKSKKKRCCYCTFVIYFYIETSVITNMMEAYFRLMSTEKCDI